ncbi:MAG: hypothetical protein, partial [Olavius algarvensis Gamma 1 endosymbiont]
YGPFATSASRSRLRLPRTTRLALRASLAGSVRIVYRFRYFNEVVQEYEQLPDGLTARGTWRRRPNPMSFRLAFMELINLHRSYLTPAQLYTCAVMYVRYSISGRVGAKRQLRDIDRPFLWALALPVGLFKGWKDRGRRNS